MNYHWKLVGLDYLVLNEDDQICGTYVTEAKANRRIRDLKAKEENAKFLARIEAKTWLKANAIARQVGCYPATSKHSYRR